MTTPNKPGREINGVPLGIALMIFGFGIFFVVLILAMGGAFQEDYDTDDLYYETDDDYDSYDTFDSENDSDTGSYDPADYNSDGEYKPVEGMTQEEIEAELESILEGSLSEDEDGW